MTDPAALITDNIAIWTAATEGKSSAGRGNGKKFSLYGIEKLRALILDLAVRGKLVPQDPNDEPASKLLKKIKSEKAKLVAEGKIQKPKPLPMIKDSENPFVLPNGWAWTRMGDVYTLEYGKNLPASKRSNSGEYPVYGSNGIVGTHSHLSVSSPCIVVGRKGSAGALNVSHSMGCWVTDVAFYSIPPKEVNLQFTYILFQTLRFEELGKGIKPGLNRNEVYPIVVAIPPLAEQKRIVAKVDELMALCDALEAETADSLAAHQKLVENLLETLTSSSDAQDLAINWARIEAHFDTLFTTEASIDTLKQTILQLAIMGKLVPQDPTDEPASELLKLFDSEKKSLIHEGKIKRAKSLPAIQKNDVPFDLPNGWEWARFPEVGIFERGKSKHRPRNDPKLFEPGIYPLIQTGEVARSQGVISEFHSKYSEVGLKQSKIWPANTLCITIAANIADAAILGFDACFPDSVVGFIPFKPISDPRYFLSFMKTAKADLLKFAPSTAQKNINLGILEKVLIPIPPLQEQLRIIAKIDELMALCDSLQGQITEAGKIQQKLADAITTQAVA